MADATFQVTFTFTAGTQPAADAKRDAALVDWAKARGLAIFQSDGVTVNPALVGPAIRQAVRSQFRDELVSYRTDLATATARATELTNVGNP